MYSDVRPYEELAKKVNAISSYAHVGIANSDDPDKVRAILHKSFKEAIRLIEFCMEILDTEYRNSTYTQLRDQREDLITYHNTILEAETTVELKRTALEYAPNAQAIQNICAYMREYYFNDTYDKFRTGRFEDMSRMSADDIENITSAINSNGSLNILSLQCRSGYNENILKQNMLGMRGINTTTYGLDVEENGVREAKSRMDKVAYGVLKGSTISNNAFDMVFLNPQPSIVSEYKVNGSLRMSNEEYILANSLRYTKLGGLLVYSIPFGFLSPTVRLFLAKNYDYITVFKNATSDLRKAAKYVTIMGIKTDTFSYSDKFDTLMNLRYSSLPEEPEYEYPLDLLETEINFFRGSELDEEELDHILLTDGLVEEFYASVANSYEPEDKAPLLPFNIGQIGLILSSGSLDGIVEENGNVKHLIKGMTIKEIESEVERTVDNGVSVTSATEIVRNKVQITALSADGTLYNLV